jgi:hypothetical protein
MTKKKTALEKLRLNELSLVNAGANQFASVCITKSFEPNPVYESIVKYYSDNPEVKDFKAILENNRKQKKMWEAREDLYPLLNALSESVSAIASNVDYTAQMRQSKIETSVNDFMAAVREVLPDIEEELQKMFEELEAGSSGDINPDGDKMSEELTKKVAELEKALGETKTELEKAYKDMASMKEEEDKKKKMEEMKKNDETVEVSGSKISKSAVGEEQFAIFKALAAEVTKSRDEAEMAKLEKRAAEEYKHVPGTASDVAKMLKAIGGMEESVAKSFEAVLKSVEEKNAVAFTTIGKSFGKQTEVAKSFDEKVAEVQKRDGISKSRAMEIAAQENPELVNEIR